MERKKNLQTDYFNGPLMEMFTIHRQQDEQKFNLILQKLNNIELLIGSSSQRKSNEKIIFTPEDVMVMFSISRRTLLSLRNDGKIGFIKIGNMVRFTKENIEEFMKSGIWQKVEEKNELVVRSRKRKKKNVLFKKLK
jgi:excisionase family DNA binding protein